MVGKGHSDGGTDGVGGDGDGGRGGERVVAEISEIHQATRQGRPHHEMVVLYDPPSL